MRPNAPPLGMVLSGVSARAGAQGGPKGGLGPFALSCWREKNAGLLAPARWLLGHYISYHKTARGFLLGRGGNESDQYP